MPTAEELVVSMKTEGAEETNAELEKMESNFEETSDSVGDSAGEMSGFASKFKGAMGAVVAGLAVAAGGLLSQVPVIGEAFGGLTSVFDAVVYQIDQKLRPALQPVTDGFYDLSAAIFDGDWEEAGNIIGDGITGFIDTIQGINFFQIGKDIADALVKMAKEIDWSEVPGLIFDLMLVNLKILTFATRLMAGIVVGLLEAASNADWGQLAMDMFGFLVSALSGAFSFVTDRIKGFVADALMFFGGFAVKAGAVIDKIKNRFVVAFGIIRDFVVNALKMMANFGISAVEGMVNGLITLVNHAIGALEGLINTAAELASRVPGVDIDEVDLDRLDEVELDRLETEGPGEILRSGQRDLQQRDRATTRQEQQQMQALNERIAQLTGTEESTISMDGRRLDENTGRYREDSTARRGRFG